MADLPKGFENAMEAIGMSGLISFMMSQELAVSLYLSGITQGRREQAEKDAKILDNTNVYAADERRLLNDCADKIRRALKNKMAELRPVSPNFILAMEEKLANGRRSYVGWDQHWSRCHFNTHPTGPTGQFMRRLQGEILELCLALASGDKKAIRHECADVANFAMFIADIHGALQDD